MDEDVSSVPDFATREPAMFYHNFKVLAGGVSCQSLASEMKCLMALAYSRQYGGKGERPFKSWTLVVALLFVLCVGATSQAYE